MSQSHGSFEDTPPDTGALAGWRARRRWIPVVALVVLAVAGGLLYQLVSTPRELYAIVTLMVPR